MHAITAVLGVTSLFMQGCSNKLFPDAFLGIGIYIAIYTGCANYIYT